MKDKLRFYLGRIAEKLWVKPLLVCLMSIGAVFLADSVQYFAVFQKVPEIKVESVEVLLEVMSATMLMMAVFAVGSMLSAYQSVSSTATPRAFSLIVSDDVSQNALSTFIGTFIYSIVGQVALINDYYEKAGRFILFVITVLVFALVIISFIRWIDGIARLGRIGTAINKVEKATFAAMCRQRDNPYLGGMKATSMGDGIPVLSDAIGYVQRIDMARLQAAAETLSARIEVAALPGTFVMSDRPLVFVTGQSEALDDEAVALIGKAFNIGQNRTFDDDPRFGLITLSEIASRALSPAVNDPGTAIEITGIYARLFSAFIEKEEGQEPDVCHDRLSVREVNLADMFDDAFNALARDGASSIEVVVRTQKTLANLAQREHTEMRQAALDKAKLVRDHAEQVLKVTQEQATLAAVSAFATEQSTD